MGLPLPPDVHLPDPHFRNMSSDCPYTIERKQEQFIALAERFRNEQDPEAANRLGDELGKMVFGG